MLLVHIDRPGPRAAYAVQHVLRHMLGWDIVLVEQLEDFINSDGPKLRYGPVADHHDHAVHVPDGGWLGSTGTGAFDPPLGSEDGIPVLFPSPGGADVFAGVFYLLSRYEEYAATTRDTHGRLPANAHFVVRHGLSEQPVVDLWALALAGRLRARFPGLPEPQRRYGHVVTLDVDNGLKVLGRPLWRQLGAAIRDITRGDIAEAGQRMATLTGRRADPFDRYGDILAAVRPEGVRAFIAFFLMRGGGRFDHAADLRHPQLREALRQISASGHVGLHPSYTSSEDHAVIAREKHELEQLSGRAISHSRQHFLRWHLPGTLRSLEDAGIRAEHSMGFSDRCGFRAGTCTPFHWYDLEQERVSDLVLHPFAAMDSALHDRMGLAPGDAAETMLAMAAQVRAVQGTFISVWHDRFLSGHGPWKGWPEAFRRVITQAAP
jgi:hypothetical protein